MKLKTILLATAATLGFTTVANAYEGLYGAIGAGLNHVQEDRDAEGLVSGVGQIWDSEADYDNGIGVYTALGYAYASGWRTELEFSYRSNDLRHLAGDGIAFAGWTGGAVGGDTQAKALMANVIRDLDFLTGAGSGKITPYLGVGVGLAQVTADWSGLNSQGSTILVPDSDDEVLAYQGIAGLAFQLAEDLTFDVSYRYFGTGETKFESFLNNLPGDVRTSFDSHSVFAGIRWNFGASQPSAPAAVQYKDCWDGSSVPVSSECPPQLVEQAAATPDPIAFTVYFDYDKSNLTPEASNLVREASARALSSDIDTVVVEGNADRSGSSAYNQTLSLRRANVVRDALIANGVPAEMIRTEAYGEDKPAKPTADGVREPLNRRTEVNIRFE